MIVDTSAVIALVFQEEEATEFARVLAASDITRISAATYLRAGIVLDSRQDPALSRQLDHLIDSAELVIESVTAEHGESLLFKGAGFSRTDVTPAWRP